MKVVIGGFYHESNTFNPFPTTVDDFVFVEGEEMLDRVGSTEIFKSAGAEIVPTIYATALSSGILTEDTYRFYADKMLDVIRKETHIDGIWLHLHGSMTVQNIGSGELQLLKEIRHIVGNDIPISLTLDIHANNSVFIKDYANIIRSYRTVPHTDQRETERITAKHLVEMIENNQIVKPALVRLPMIIGGEQALGDTEPMVSIFNKLEQMEQMEGILTASFFIGFSWADTDVSAASVVVVPEADAYADLAQKQAEELGEFVYAKRHEFQFDALVLKPEEAVDKALLADVKPVFISDSGDNTTGGAVGINTVLLRMFLSRQDLKGKKVCIAAIFDEEAFDECAKCAIGQNVRVNVGINYDENSKSVLVEGVLKAKGALMGYLGSTSDKVGEVCTVSCGQVDVVIANRGDSFITINHFTAAGLTIYDYDIVVLKQGYLFAELSAISKLDILALTPGATYQLLEELPFKRISRTMFQLDQ